MYKLSIYTGFAMGTVLSVVGMWLLLTQPAELRARGFSPAFMGALLLVYGFFRLYRSYSALRAERRAAAHERLLQFRGKQHSQGTGSTEQE